MLSLQTDPETSWQKGQEERYSDGATFSLGAGVRCNPFAILREVSEAVPAGGNVRLE
jgi:hypothetical protein